MKRTLLRLLTYSYAIVAIGCIDNKIDMQRDYYLDGELTSANSSDPSDPNGFNLGTSTMVVATPSIVVDNDETITIDFPTAGTNFDGLDETIYAHAGLITSESGTSIEWQYAPSWCDNSAKYRLSDDDGDGIHTLTIEGGLRQYFDVSDNNEILSYIALVFRNKDGSIEQKDGTKDIYVKISVEGALVVNFVSPTNKSVVAAGEPLDVKIQINEDADMAELYSNNSLVGSFTMGAATPSIPFTPPTTGDYTLTVKAKKGDQSEQSSISFFATDGSTQDIARPSGANEGVTLSNDRTSATFVLYAPGKSNVVLLGDFNDYTPSAQYMMNRDTNIETPDNGVVTAVGSEEYFWITIDGLEPDTEYGYQYLVDGDILIADPYCQKILDPWNDSYIEESVYPDLKKYPSAHTQDLVSVFSTGVEKEFVWAPFERPSPPSLVIYELLIRDFTSQGSIDGVLDKLDYIEGLGVNAVELMPIQEFSGNDSWGYNPSFLFATDKAYGTKEDYKTLVNELHKRGIAVILDVVFNHLTGDHPWMRMWIDEDGTAADNNPFFHKEAKHPYSVYNDIKHYPNGKMDRHVKEVLTYLLEEFNIDGFRFDLSKGITNGADETITDVGEWSAKNDNRIEILTGWIDAIAAVDDSAYMTFEHLADYEEEYELVNYNTNVKLWKKFIEPFSENTMGYADGTDKTNFGGCAYPGYINIIEDHDEERIGYKIKMYGPAGVKDDLSVIKDRTTASFAFHMLSPGAKMMWQFGEMGYDISINYIDRTAKKPVRWDYLYDANRRELCSNISKIINFRKDNQDDIYYYDCDYISSGSLDNMNNNGNVWYTSDSDMGGKILSYTVGDESVLVVANFNTEGGAVTTTVNNLRSGTWQNLITGEEYNIDSSSHQFTLSPHQYIILVNVN